MEYKKHRFNIYPEMQPEEFDRLRANLLSNGYDAKNPIWLFEGAILDGWNRYRACLALNINPVFKTFEGSELDAMQFTIRTNDRRDLTSSQRAAIAVEAEGLVAALKAEAAKRQIASGGDKKSDEFKKSVRELIPEPINREQHRPRTQLAETFGTNPRYVSDAAKIKAENPEAFAAIKAGEKTITEFKKEEKERRAHVANNSGENEWYTPECYIESARLVMGSIDLDPGSSQIANQRVKASIFYTQQDDGLQKEWAGNIWMNPPYSQPLIAQFIAKLVESEGVNQAVVLVNNGTETAWGQMLLRASSAVCFHQSRIRFIDPQGNLGQAPLQGQMICYIGNNPETFSKEFSKYGTILQKG